MEEQTKRMVEMGREKNRKRKYGRVRCVSVELCARAVIITDSYTIVIWIEERCGNRQKGKLFYH